MGGSLARGLRPFAKIITAVDPAHKSLDAALQLGVINQGTADLATGIKDADLVILATPVRTILDIIERLPTLRPDGCMVFDLGSTKGQVCAAMDALPATFQAIGGHPMCGKESSGFSQTDPDLYRDKTFVLCRTTRTTTLIEQIALQIITAVSSHPLFLQPTLHDELVSLTSHLPYLLSSLLMRQAAESARQQDSLWQVSASGFRDTSRLSGSNPAVMGDILQTNRSAVLAQLSRHHQAVEELITILESEKNAELMAWLEKAQQGYQEYKKHKR
jgi:prephenate dehydrogenase